MTKIQLTCYFPKETLDRLGFYMGIVGKKNRNDIILESLKRFLVSEKKSKKFKILLEKKQKQINEEIGKST